jgi:ATP-binding cassette, subfamily G (WHITE), member 2, PDR
MEPHLLFKAFDSARNLEIILALMAFYCSLCLLATEYISLQSYRGEVLLFPHSKLRKMPTKEDEET